MDTNPSSYSDWEAFFATKPVAQLVTYVVVPESTTTFSKLAALRNRFLEIAFHDKSTSPNFRRVAASWIRALESLIYALHIDDDSLLETFAKDRAIGIQHALEYGYGSALYLASEGNPGFLDRLFSGKSVTSDREAQFRDELVKFAFGNTNDEGLV
ncbi:MAG: hypothetical protein HYX43_02610 [Burkholderiales bacterium]|nr:hypothetical protein [Burkholderiales bacterium]